MPHLDASWTLVKWQKFSSHHGVEAAVQKLLQLFGCHTFLGHKSNSLGAQQSQLKIKVQVLVSLRFACTSLATASSSTPPRWQQASGQVHINGNWQLPVVLAFCLALSRRG
ncbi:hypothetical protein ACLKA7_002044 [Drosophila subpalustris]